jgi:hypothetical protein
MVTYRAPVESMMVLEALSGRERLIPSIMGTGVKRDAGSVLKQILLSIGYAYDTLYK